MRGTIIRIAAAFAIAAAAAGAVTLLPQSAGTAEGPQNNVLRHALDVEMGGNAPAKDFTKKLSGGTMYAVLQGAGVLDARADAQGGGGGSGNVGFAKGGRSDGCPNTLGAQNGDPSGAQGGGPANIRVNQDCSLRRQAEEWGAVNPTDFSNVLGGQNDSVIGFNHCGYDWSLDFGHTWGSVGTAPPPFWQTILRDGHTSDACSDPAGTFDQVGNAYVVGLLFDINSAANGIFVAKSNAPNGGSFYHIPAQLPFQEYRTTPMGRVASDIDPDIFNDKELMVGDTRPASAKKGRLYVTWTRFEANGTEVGGRSPIVFSQSLDGGATWSRPIIISGTNGSFCSIFSGTPDNPNACDQDQGSDPVVGPDGTIYVVFGNGNTPQPGVNQVLMVKCPATNNCDKESDWTPPTRVGDLIGFHPIGDPGNVGGCPTGRQCLPPNGYRVPEFTSMSISVDQGGTLYAVWSDARHINHPPCGPLLPWSVAKPPCNNDVFYAFSKDGGTTWSPTFNITAPLGETAQWQPWSDVTGDGKYLEVAFYDRHYGNCEFTGCADITHATVFDPASATPSVKFDKITTSSMPNLVPANNPLQAGFLGDYMWLEVSRLNFAQPATHIWWADTRPIPYRPSTQQFPEEDVYYAKTLHHGGPGGTSIFADPFSG
jgi:hypothetical protein